MLAPDNRPPVATDGTVEVEAGTVGAVAIEPFVSDPDTVTGDVLTYELLDRPGHAGGIHGFPRRADRRRRIDRRPAIPRHRRAGATAEATITMTITPSSAPPPTAVADTARTTQGVPITVDVVANDIDPLGRGLQVVATGVQDGVGGTSVAGDGRSVTFNPGGDFFGTATVSYTVQDARGGERGQATGQLVVEVIGLPGKPATPQATADNATATVTWGQAAANGSPIDDVEIESDQVAVARDRRGQQLHLHAGSSTAWRTASRSATTTRPAGARGASGPRAVTPDTQPGRPASPTVTFGDGSLLVVWSAPANEGSAITGYQLEIGGGASRRAGARQRDELHVDRADQRHELPVPGHGRQRRRTVRARRRGPPPSTRSASPARPARPAPVRATATSTSAGRRPADNGDPVIEYQVERAVRSRRLRAGDGDQHALERPAQRRRAAVPGAGPQP